MKKLVFAMMLCPVLLLMASCTGSTDNAGSTVSSVSDAGGSEMEKLDADLRISNAQMPMKVDYATTLLSITRDGHVVTYHYEVDEDAVAFEDLVEYQEDFRTNLKKEIKGASAVTDFVSLVLDAGCELCYEYKGNQSGRTMELEFGKDELETMR